MCLAHFLFKSTTPLEIIILPILILWPSKQVISSKSLTFELYPPPGPGKNTMPSKKFVYRLSSFLIKSLPPTFPVKTMRINKNLNIAHIIKLGYIKVVLSRKWMSDNSWFFYKMGSERITNDALIFGTYFRAPYFRFFH